MSEQKIEKTSIPLVLAQNGAFVALDFDLAARIRNALDQIQESGGFGTVTLEVFKDKVYVKVQKDVK